MCVRSLTPARFGLDESVLHRQDDGTLSYIGNEHLVTENNCEVFSMNGYLFEKYGMMFGLDHWWDGYGEEY